MVSMRLIIHQEAESTQDLAREWAIRGEPEGLASGIEPNKGRGHAAIHGYLPQGKTWRCL
jgi:hypothetical protein